MSTSGHGPVKAKDLAARAEQLPLLPAVVMRVLTLDPGSEHYFEGLVTLAQEDPTFAVRLVRLANAPASAPAKLILTVRQAVVRLGPRECAGLVTALARPGTRCTRGRCGSSQEAAAARRAERQA